MDMERVRTVAQTYLNLLASMGYTPKEVRSYKTFHRKKTELRHAAWMCQRIIETVEAGVRDAMSREKIMRWLGHVQGLLSAYRVRVVYDQRKDARM